MNKLYISLTIIFLFFCGSIYSQNPKVYGGEFEFNSQNKPCITSTQRLEIKNIIEKFTKKFRSNQGKNKPMSQLFEWPVAKSSDSPYFEAWAISNYVDHNTGFPQQVQDYNCGTRTYDTNSGYNHQGVDIFTWPFSWDQFYNNQAEVIAAAPGVIIQKSDGNFDQSCSFNSNNWNSVYIQHSDGSIALYGHMKSNTLTSKTIGQSVTTGEFLGVIGSSGNSTGPHLHFEVFDSNNNLIDPFTGNCNNLNNTSWWNTQINYREPNINGMLTSSTPPSFNTCPQAEMINQKSNFEYGETAYFSIYLRDQIPGMNIYFKLISPSGSINLSWSRTLNNTYNASYWYSSFPITSTPFSETGEWTYEATFNNTTESINFSVGQLSIAEENFSSNVSIYPNPFNQQIKLSSLKNLQQVDIYDINGRLIHKILTDKSEVIISTYYLSSGVYFLQATNIDNNTVTKKIIKK